MNSSEQFAKFTLASVAGLGICIQSFASISVINNTGDNLSGESSATAESFSTPSMNDFGELTFAVNFEEFENGDSTRFEGICLYDGAETHLLASVDTIAPKPGDDGVFEYFYKPTISELGISFFRGKMQGSQWSRNTNGTWLGWTVTQSGETRPKLDMLNRIWDRAAISYDGSTAEDGGVFYNIGHPQVVQPRSFAFIAELDDGNYEDRSGVWFQGANASGEWEIPRPELIALQGEALPGHTEILGTIESYTPIDSEKGLLLATLAHGDGIETSNDLALYLTSIGDDAVQIAQTGDNIDNQQFASLSAPSYNNSGLVTFWGSLNNSAEDEGIYSYLNGTISTEVSTQVPFIVDDATLDINSLYDPKTNDGGAICVLATLETGGQAILYKDDQGTWSIIAKTGDQAPGAKWGVIFERFNVPNLNTQGQVCFIATLSGTGDAISDTTDSGIWATDTNGNLTLVAQEGDLINAGEGKLRNLSSYSIGDFTESGQISLLLKFTNHGSAIATAQVEDATAPVIAIQPNTVSNFNGEHIEFSVRAEGQGPFTYQWSKDGNTIEGATASTLNINSADQSDEGDYSVTITSAIGSTNSNVAGLSLQEWPDLPIFTDEPLGEIALIGNEATLTSRALSNLTITYQWYKDGEILDGSTSQDLLIEESSEDDEGNYYVIATSSSGSTQSASAEILVTEKRLINISTRARVGTGANVVIAGFSVDGDSPKQLLIRGVGPSLAQFNVLSLIHI